MDHSVFSNQFTQACYWKESMSWPLKVPPKELPQSADVVVIGSGFTGLSAARSLAKAGVQVVLLESEEIGSGASSRNGGIVHPTLGVGVQVLIKRYGLERAKSLYNIIFESFDFLQQLVEEEWIDCHLNVSGAFEAAARPKHLEWMHARRDLLDEVFDHHTNVIGPDELNKYVGGNLYSGGWHDPLGATVHPARLVYGLGEAALRAGADLHPHTPALDIESRDSKHEIKTPRGIVRTDSIVMATNGYMGDIFPEIRRRIIPINIVAVATETMPAELADRMIPKRYCFWDSFRLFHYYQRTEDDRLVFGGVSGLRRGGVMGEAAAVYRRMTRIFPELADVKLDYAWEGDIALTFDQLPHLGQMEDIHYAIGFNGDGVLLGCYLGAKIAEMVLGKGEPTPLVEIPFPTMAFYRRRTWFMPFARAFNGFLDVMGL
jgi:glycine/D-amino acid oxidase-like deaminating enzyme